MLGLTPLGIAHTAVSLIAIVCGVLTVSRHREITGQSAVGRIYLATTLLAALSALGIYQHGGFGPPHGLAVLCVLALITGAVAAQTRLFGAWSRRVQTLAYSATLLFHAIPGVTEALTRLPLSQPVLPGADAKAFGPIYGVLVLIFVLGVRWQWRWLSTQTVSAKLSARRT